MTDLWISSVASTTYLDTTSESSRILRSMMNFAQVLFGAPAASIFTYDEAADELLFEAASGLGSSGLLGKRMSATEGIAGMVIQTGMATIASDLVSNATFNRDFAAQSGYVPDTICAAPLLRDDDLLGVIEILDPDLTRFGSLDVMTVVEALADQVAESLYVLRELRRSRLSATGTGGRREQIARLVQGLPDEAFQDGRCNILEAVLTELSRPGG